MALDLASLAGIIMVIGTGVDQLVIITDEVIKRGEAAPASSERSIKERRQRRQRRQALASDGRDHQQGLSGPSAPCHHPGAADHSRGHDSIALHGIRCPTDRPITRHLVGPWERWCVCLWQDQQVISRAEARSIHRRPKDGLVGQIFFFFYHPIDVNS